MFSKNTIKKLYYTILNLSGLTNRYLNQIKKNNQLTILNLHKISPHNNEFYPALHPKLFEELLIFIKSKFTIILLNQINDITNINKPLLILSFDDGYYDFLEYAVPLLKKHEVNCNLNIIPKCVETGQAMWNIQLYDYLNNLDINKISNIKINGFNYKIKNYSDKTNYGLKISRFLKNQPKKNRDLILQPLLPDMNQSKFKTRMLNKENIVEISEFHELGAHSYSHESMEFEDLAFFKNDFNKCKIYFDQILKYPLYIYAFPNGSHTKEQIDFLTKKEIKHILLVENEYTSPKAISKNRFTFYANSKNEVKLRATGYFHN